VSASRPISPRPAFRSVGDRADISIRDAAIYWLAAWVLGQFLSVAVMSVSGHTTLAEAGPAWLLAVAVAGWLPMVAAVVLASRKFGTGSLARDFGYRWSPVDLLGFPIGVGTQLLLLPLVYWPLKAIWPHTFAQSKLEQRAHDLSSHASGAGKVLLFVVVVVGAPLVEELVYRGMLQTALTRRLRDGLGVVLVAAWFAIVHFQPIETPGLFVIGLVLGACALYTRRLGMGVMAHMAFNATGLVLVAMA
jgi:membrane protease YdiL (CAAX protease family)